MEHLGELDAVGRTTQHWHLDKRVPIALLTAIVLQLAGFVWYSSKLDSRVGSLETWVRDNSATTTRLSVIETQLGDIKGGLDRIYRKLDGER